MAITDRENTLRTLEFRYPEWIPCRVLILPTHLESDREKCEKLVKEHPRIFTNQNLKDYGHLGERFKKGYLRDSWGCLWRNEIDGIAGIVVEHPLDDWEKLKDYKPPDPLVTGLFDPRDWDVTKKQFDKMREQGFFVEGNCESFFDLLYALRGFENLMIDLATDDPHLPKLIEMVTQYELKLIDKWLEIGVDSLYFHSDMGTQQTLMISPEKFRQYIKPVFKKLFKKCRNAGVHVRFSADGVLLSIIDDLIECGISMHDPQLRANGLENIVRMYKGKICIDLDLDRQMFPTCSPDDIYDQVKECVEALYLPEGGLMLSASNSPDVPIENIQAQCDAFEEFCFPNDK
jgi:uroporphyrinogen decarboxylase